MKYDIAVIGGGPGGYVAAIKAAQEGASVVLFEEDKLGGTCLNRGCIPTKAILKSSGLLKEIRNCEGYGIHIGDVSFDFGEIMKRKDAIVSQLVGGVGGLVRKNGVKLVNAHADIVRPGLISAGAETFECSDIILACGSVPAKVPIPGIEYSVNSDYVLSMETLPKSVAIVGGGVIGVEFAEMLNNLDCKVTVVEMLPHLLSMADASVIDYIEKKFRKSGIEVLTGSAVQEILQDGLVCKTGNEIKKIQAECVVVATGRVPNTNRSELDRLGIRHDRGRVETNEKMQTSVRHIYAIGDANGKSMLAHTASREAIIAVNNILGKPCTVSYDAIPSCVYTTPEIAWVGLTEKQAGEMGLEYKTGLFPTLANGKSLIEGETDGFLKIIADEKTGEILGVHYVCAHATDMIAEIAALMNAEGTVEDICNTVHPHPTVSESVMEAAEAVFGKPIHF